MVRPILALLFVGAAACGLAAQAATVQILALHDNTLYEDAAGLLSNGGGQYLFVGLTPNAKRRALLAFDIAASIPTKSRIVDVQLRLVSSRSRATAPTVATLHR